MIRRLAIALVVLGMFASFFILSCEQQKKELKHIKSNVIGIKRTVTLYDCSGNRIKSWHGRFKVEIQGGTASFIDDAGHEVKIHGTYVVEEVD